MACTHYMGICDHLVCDKVLAQDDAELDLLNEPAEPRFQAAMAFSDGCQHTTQALQALALVLESYDDPEGAAILRDAARRMAAHEASRL